MKVAVLFSGGKDSVFAAFCCVSSGYDVELLTVKPAEYSTMFHHPNVGWCAKQAKAMGLKITVAKAEGKEEEDELLAVKKALADMNADAVAAGAIESEYQKERVDRIAHELGIISLAPIWRCNETLLSEQCTYLESRVVAVAAEGLDRSMLGRKFDSDFAEYLRGRKPHVSAHLEGGEGETFVTNAPFFKKKLKITKCRKTFDGARGVMEITGLS